MPEPDLLSPQLIALLCSRVIQAIGRAVLFRRPMPSPDALARAHGRGSRRRNLRLVESLESRCLLSAYATLDYFPMDGDNWWTYAGTANGIAVTSTRTSNLTTLTNGSSATQFTDSPPAMTRTYGFAPESGLWLYSQTTSQGSAVFDLPLHYLSATLTEGQVLSWSNVPYTVSGSLGGTTVIYYGTDSGISQVVALENVTTPKGDFSALKVVIEQTQGYSGVSSGYAFTVCAHTVETFWLASHIGMVQGDVTADTTISVAGQNTYSTVSQSMILMDSNLLVSANQPPTARSFDVTLKPNATQTFAAGDFTAAFSDPDATDTLQMVRITTLPGHGTLTLNNLPVTQGQEIAVGDLDSLSYTPAAGYSGTDSFEWNGSDGSLYADTSASVNLTINNTPPVLAPFSLSSGRNTPVTLGSAPFLAAFTDADAGDTLVQVAFTALPTYGTLLLSGVPVFDFQVIPFDQLANLTYSPNRDFAGADAFRWNASDGVNYASNAAALDMNVSGLAPTVSPIAKAVVQNSTAMAFRAWDFISAFTEPNLGPTLQSITVTSLPAHGTLTLNGNAVTAGTLIAALEMANLRYQPDSDYIGGDAFGWNGSDGLNSALNASTVSLTVVPANTLTLTGNNCLIPAGNSATSPVNFTDFGPLGIVSNIDGYPDVRTYTITNNSGATVDFTGGATLIRISGPNAGDFSASGFTDAISYAPLTSLLPGQSARFTITFAPQGVGRRSATVAIPVSAGDDFTFDVAGTGLDTIDNNDPTSTLYGLQYATTQPGTGDGALRGDVLTVNYSGFLLDGTLVDSSLNPGRTPFQFALLAPGQPQVITGWDPGLQGLKVGEKRTLILPASLAYGSTGTGSIPPNATMIFEVECLGIGVPRLGMGVVGYDRFVTPQSTTASLIEGTDFGALAATQSSLTVSFALMNVGYQGFPDAAYPCSTHLWYTATPSVVLGGADSSDFVLAANGATFTVQFLKPADSAPRTATITILTNDPVFPDFFVTIRASAATDDLAPTLSDIALTTSINAATALGYSDFAAGFSDPDPGATLQAVRITSLPGHGTLTLNDVPVTQGQEIIAGDLDALSYTPAAGYVGADSFGWNGFDGTLYAASAASVTIAVAGPHLAIVNQPATTIVAGASMTSPIVVHILNADNQVVTADNKAVRISLINTANGASLKTFSVGARKGVATLTNLTIKTAGTYIIRASQNGFAPVDSVEFTVTPAVAARMVFTLQPPNAVAGQSFPAQVTLKDKYGNVATNDLSSVTLTSNPAGWTDTQAVQNGTANFSGILTIARRYKLVAANGTLRAVSSKNFTVSPDSASSRLVLLQPLLPTATALVGRTIKPAIKLAVQDQFGNIVKSNPTLVTATIADGPLGAVLKGTVTRKLNNGTVTFGNLSLSMAGNYTLAFSDLSLALVTPVELTAVVT
jgi:hypothetical protein